jgi:hypothetical protein
MLMTLFGVKVPIVEGKSKFQDTILSKLQKVDVKIHEYQILMSKSKPLIVKTMNTKTME